MEGTTRRTTPSSITMHDVLRDRHDIEHSAMRKHHSKSAQVGAVQGAGRGMGIPAAISPAVLHRTLPCPGTWTSQLLCRPCASDFHATRSAHSRVGREGTALHFGTIAVTLGGQASARPASPILSQEWTEIPGTSPSSWDRILEPSGEKVESHTRPSKPTGQ